METKDNVSNEGADKNEIPPATEETVPPVDATSASTTEENPSSIVETVRFCFLI